MKKLKFKGKEPLKAYHGKGVDFVDGEIKEVANDTAKYLLDDFPEYFEEIKPKKKQKRRKKEVRKPFKDKMIRKAKSK